MAIALVASAGAGAASSPVTSAIDTTGATILIVFVAENAAPGVTVSDSKANTWVGLTAQNGNTPDGRFWYVANPTVGSGHTFTAGGSSVFAAICAAAWSGVATVSPLDQQNSSSGGAYTSANAQPGSITPSENGELIVTAVGSGAATTLTAPTGFAITNQVTYTGGTNYGGAIAWQEQVTAAAINPLWTLSATTNGCVLVASFKAGSAPPATKSSFRRRRPQLQMR